MLPRHLNFWLQWIAHPLAYTGQQWLKHAEETHLSEFQRITRSNSRIQGQAPAQRGPVCERKKDSNVKDAKWWPVQHHFEYSLWQILTFWAHDAHARLSSSRVADEPTALKCEYQWFRLSSFARSVKLRWVQTSIMDHHHSPNGSKWRVFSKVHIT